MGGKSEGEEYRLLPLCTSDFNFNHRRLFLLSTCYCLRHSNFVCVVISYQLSGSYTASVQAAGGKAQTMLRAHTQMMFGNHPHWTPHIHVPLTLQFL